MLVDWILHVYVHTEKLIVLGAFEVLISVSSQSSYPHCADEERQPSLRVDFLIVGLDQTRLTDFNKSLVSTSILVEGKVSLALNRPLIDLLDKLHSVCVICIQQVRHRGIIFRHADFRAQGPSHELAELGLMFKTLVAVRDDPEATERHSALWFEHPDDCG